MMKKIALWIAASLLLIGPGAIWAATPLEITLFSDNTNPPSPQMGDHMKFVSAIRNSGAVPAQGVVAWISLIQVDPGHEQPLDLEDWSAHKAVTQPSLAPGSQIKVEWPMRLIQAGDYRVVISAVERSTPYVMTSPFIDFHVYRKPVVESRRILPIAIGAPLILGALTLWRIRDRA
jgi:hypothetical protein